jgi:beta-lactamase class D
MTLEPFPENMIYKDADPVLANLLDSIGVQGIILVYDPQAGMIVSNDISRADKRVLPASTFKIPNSIIALEHGIVDDENTLFQWDGIPRALSVWDRDMTFREAFHSSCVPCFQEVARMINAQRMIHMLSYFGYGQMVISEDNIDMFWLEGESRISPREQLDFITRFYNQELPVSIRTHNLMKDLMVIENHDYKLSGKTGWAIRQGNNTGWFVGFAEKDQKVYFIVTCIEPSEEFNMQMFNLIRKNISVKALEQLGLI